MTPATALLDADADADADAAVAAAACEWCGDALSSPYLRRPGGLGLHVACARAYARTVVDRSPSRPAEA